MPQPQAYERVKDFTQRDGDETDHAGINDEFDAVAASIAGVRTNLAQLQKDDGSLKNGIVGADQLAPSAFDAVLGEINQVRQDTQDASQSALTSATTAVQAAADAAASIATVQAAENATNLNAASAAASASSANTSKLAAAASEASALASKNAAAASETAAAASASTATTGAGTATTQAGIATAQAAIATTKASEASASATTASTAAGTATTKAGEASTSAAQAASYAASAAAAAASVNPETLVQLAGDQTIAGIKTFSSPISGSITGNAESVSGIFSKYNSQSVIYTKTGASTLAVSAYSIVRARNATITVGSTSQAVVMPALTAGTDYAIYACDDLTFRADASFTAPTGYTAANSRLIGGFHYGLVAPGTTLAGGSFNTAGSVDTGGMVWVQGDVDNIAGINKFSLWDLKWRANVSDLRGQKGFVLTDAGNWVAIYYASSNPDANGLSKYNTDVASGTVLPKIPATMGGNGTLTYADFNWWRASEMARAYGARLLTDAEANIAFFGVTENQSLGGASSTIPLTTRQAGYTSKYGVEQATGHHWVWGDDSAGTPSAYVANGGRGQSYASGVYKVILGGARDNAANSGSRASNWGVVPTDSGWNIGLRAACDHLMLA